MVTKLPINIVSLLICLILAKNHMVTKLIPMVIPTAPRLILAKNHMVTKPQIHVTIYLKIIKY